MGRRLKRVVLLCFLFITGSASFCQPLRPDYQKVDREVAFINADEPASLAMLLTQPYALEKEKVRAIFKWISLNISYHRAVAVNRGRRNKSILSEEETETDTLYPLTERVARKVLKDRRTHCDGYARLFKALCDHAGIQSVIISGYGRTGSEKADSRFSSNHSWNAVFLDSSWQLLDVTWASGFITYGAGDFVQQFNEEYFLVKPEEFILQHYPDDLRWSLLEEPPAIDEFRKQPFHPRSFGKYQFSEYFPAKGIIHARVGDTIRLVMERLPQHKIAIVPDSIWDASALMYTPVYAYVKPTAASIGNTLHYEFPVENTSVKWLHLMYNDDAVLRYRLQILPGAAKEPVWIGPPYIPGQLISIY